MVFLWTFLELLEAEKRGFCLGCFGCLCLSNLWKGMTTLAGWSSSLVPLGVLLEGFEVAAPEVNLVPRAAPKPSKSAKQHQIMLIRIFEGIRMEGLEKF